MAVEQSHFLEEVKEGATAHVHFSGGHIAGSYCEGSVDDISQKGFAMGWSAVTVVEKEGVRLAFTEALKMVHCGAQKRTRDKRVGALTRSSTGALEETIAHQEADGQR